MGFHKAEEKVYAVEFMTYTNCMRDAVYCEENSTYLSIDRTNAPLLVKESDLPKYQKYGGGFKNLHYVGSMVIEGEGDGEL